MKIEMANIMVADADHHVTTRRIEIHAEILFGPRIGHKPLIRRVDNPWWPELIGAVLATERLPIDGTDKSL